MRLVLLYFELILKLGKWHIIELFDDFNSHILSSYSYRVGGGSVFIKIDNAEDFFCIFSAETVGNRGKLI